MYCLYIIDRQGNLELITESEKPERIRKIAHKIKEKPGRSILIFKNGKKLSGGRNALDKELYMKWLERNDIRK